jgi:hypothetical protein
MSDVSTKRLHLTAAGLLRGSRLRLDETLPAFIAALKDDPKLLQALASGIFGARRS